VCALHGARELGRAVKWTDDRSGSFVSDSQGRNHDMLGELAMDKDGHFLALRISGYTNLGAYVGQMAAGVATGNAVKNIQTVYRTPLLEVSVKSMLTNTTFISSYRGAGRPEGNFYVERLVDLAAEEMGIDRLELRRRNFIQPKQFPYHTASDSDYDSGDFPALLQHALDAADVKGFAARRSASKGSGKLRGLGVGSFLEVTAPAGKELGGIIFNKDGTVTIRTGTLDLGMGHATPFAQVLTTTLGIPFDKIRLMQTDSDLIPVGGGSGGSKSIMSSGKAIVDASKKVIERGKQIAGQVLEAAASDIEFANGRFSIAGTDRVVGIMELAAKIHTGLKLPPDLPQTLDVQEVFDTPPSSFPNGCHIAEVEVDPETGETEVVRYMCVNDFGVEVNPLIVAGQVQGGVVQAIGQALMEDIRYDDDGQLLTGSYMDYAMPRAHNMPSISVTSHPVPAVTNPLGVKGCGEAGCAGGLTSVMNAVADALSEYGIKNIDMPATPPRVWAAIQAAKASKAA
jgi:carbon-monoxide dehydrogenase large subunit